MKATIQFIGQELKGLYPEREIKAFTRLILEKVCGYSFTRQLLAQDEVLNDHQRNDINQIVQRLKAFEPIQYILGETEFCGIPLRVTPSVLIPRPETEELVQWISETEFSEKAAVLDVGTGSGCIALGIKKLIPDVNMQAVDVSDEVLEVALVNAAANHMDVDFFKADILQWELYDWGKYDVIVSNPPYVRELEKVHMEANVLDYEPESALFVPNTDPLRFYRRIAAFAACYLKPDGWLFFEINEALGNEMKALAGGYGFSRIEIRKDLSGKDRMLRCCKK